jgi:hypothetical protein
MPLDGIEAVELRSPGSYRFLVGAYSRSKFRTEFAEAKDEIRV